MSKTHQPDGVSLIAAERNKQINVNGYTAAHDDDHGDSALAITAARLCLNETSADVVDPRCRVDSCWGILDKWGHDRKKQLVIAGALIAAEIDRLLRLEAV